MYSFHFYDPVELTSLAAYRQGLDRAAMARLPFPVDNQADCAITADTARGAVTGDLMRYYCRFGWTDEKVNREIDTAAIWASQHHVRLIAGEFGASADLNPAARLAWLRTEERGPGITRHPLGTLGLRRRHGFRRGATAGTAPAAEPGCPVGAGHADRNVIAACRAAYPSGAT